MEDLNKPTYWLETSATGDAWLFCRAGWFVGHWPWANHLPCCKLTIQPFPKVWFWAMEQPYYTMLVLLVLGVIQISHGLILGHGATIICHVDFVSADNHSTISHGLSLGHGATICHVGFVSNCYFSFNHFPWFDLGPWDNHMPCWCCYFHSTISHNYVAIIIHLGQLAGGSNAKMVIPAGVPAIKLYQNAKQMLQGPSPEFFCMAMEDIYHKEDHYRQWVQKLDTCHSYIIGQRYKNIP